MSTRAVYGFKDSRGTHWVYVHHDGYPTGAASKFDAVLKSKLAWPLPRWEADEFGAAFVAANKTGPGSVMLTSGPDAHDDIEYVYVVTDQLEDGKLRLTASYPGNGEPFFQGTLTTFVKTAKQIENKLHQD